MQFEILGPLTVTAHDGKPVSLRGFGRRATLAFLLLHANQVVPAGALVRALWGDTPPTTARKMLQNNISALRAALHEGAGGRASALLLTHAPGYLLNVEEDAIDLCRFERLAESGHAALAAGDHHHAAGRLRRALSLWRGRALEDLAEPADGWSVLRAVEGRRYSVWEDRIEAELALGLHQQVVGELEVLTAAAPHRERLRGQLMLALYRCGRQVDALNVYRQARETLMLDIGLEPGSALRHLEQAILRQDPAIMAGGMPRPWDHTARVPTGPVTDASTAHRAREAAAPQPSFQNLGAALFEALPALPARDAGSLADIQRLSARIGELVAREVTDFLAAGAGRTALGTGPDPAVQHPLLVAAPDERRPITGTGRFGKGRAS